MGCCDERRHVALRQSSWGREHLVDLERSEQIYLVIRDHSVNMQRTFSPFQLVFRLGIHNQNYEFYLFQPYAT